MKKYLITTFILIHGMILVSQSSIAQQKKYSFRDLEKLVLEKDADVQAARKQVEAAAYYKAVGNQSKWPGLSMFYRYTPDNLAFDDNGTFGSHYLDIRLSQDLISLVERNPQNKSRNANKALQEANFAAAKNDILLSFRLSYIDVLEDSLRVAYYSKLDTVFTALLKLKKGRFDYQEDLLIDLLTMQKEAIHNRTLLNFSKNNLTHRKHLIAENLGISANAIEWSKQEAVDFRHALSVAEADSIQNAEIDLLQARASLEYSRTYKSSQRFRLSPFIGYQLRANRFATKKSSAEIGLRASLPLSVFSNQHENEQAQLRGDAWQLKAQKARRILLDKIERKQEKYRFLKEQIVDDQMLLRLIKEKENVQKNKQIASIKSLKTTPGLLLELAVEKYKTELSIHILRLEREKLLYEIMHLAGTKIPPKAERLDALSPAMQPDSSEVAIPATKAFWVWNPVDLIEDVEKSRQFFSICRTNHINKIYLSFNKGVVEQFLAGDQGRLFLQKLNANHISFSALMGDAQWVTSTTQNELKSKLNAFAKVQHTLADSLQFEAIHLDIEPQSLQNWAQNKRALLEKTVATVTDIKRVLSAQKTPVNLELDIPASFAKIDSALFKELVLQTDVVTLMAYGNHFGSIEKAAKPTILFLTNLHKPFVIGINAALFDSDKAVLDMASRLTGTYENNPNFHGFAIHDYHRFKDLTKRE